MFMLMVIVPIDLFLYARAEKIEPVNGPVHYWDLNIEEIKDKYWRYQAKTDTFKVKFPKKLDEKSAKVTTFKDRYTLEFKIKDLECSDFTDRTNGSFKYEKPSKVKPSVDGEVITYPGVYPNIDLTYEVGFDQCKETFVINSMPEDISGDLMFNTRINYNTSELQVYCSGIPINESYYGKGEEIIFKDDQGKQVYRIPRPVIFDTPDTLYDTNFGRMIKDRSTIDTIDCLYLAEPCELGIKLRYYLPYNYMIKDTTKFPVYLDPSISPSTITDSITYEGWFNNTIKRTDSSGVTYLAGTEIVQNSTISINSGGTLTLNNITLKINGTADGACSINVNDGGCLNIVNGTLLTWGTNQKYYCLNYNADSLGVIDESTIERVSDDYSGIYIRSDISIIGSTIRYCKGDGIYVYDSSPLLYENVICSNTEAGLLVGYGGVPKIYRNEFSGNYDGIIWDGNYWRDDFNDQTKIYQTTNVIVSGGKASPQDLGAESSLVSEEISLSTQNIYDHIAVDKVETTDCVFKIDVLDGDTREPIPGLENLTGENIDIVGINPFEHDSICLLGKFIGNRSAIVSVNRWDVHFRAVDYFEERVEDASDPILNGTHLFNDRVILGGTGFENEMCYTDDFNDSSLDDRWTKSSFGGASGSDIGVDGSSNLYPISYGSGSGWHGPSVIADITNTNASFIAEIDMDEENDYSSMGYVYLKMQDENENSVYRVLWTDSWAYNDKSKILFYDDSGNKYNSGMGTTYNDFSGKMKIVRHNNDRLEFYIDNGDGYEQITLSTPLSSTSLENNIQKIRIDLARCSSYNVLPKNKQDWVGFCGDFNETGYYITDRIESNSHCMWDTIAIDKTEPDVHHRITTTVLDGLSGDIIDDYSEMRGDMIDIGKIKVSEHPSIKLKFTMIGNGTTTPELYSWKVHTTPAIYENCYSSNSHTGISCDYSRPMIIHNYVNNSAIGILTVNSTESPITSENHEQTYEITDRDDFLSHGKLSDWSNISIINGRAQLETGYTEGYIISENLSLYDICRWYRLDILRNVPENCEVNISVIDPSTGSPISGYNEIDSEEIYLINIDPYTYSTIKLKVLLSGDGSSYPSISKWELTTKIFTEFNDTFNDVNQIDSGYNVVLNNGDIRLNNRSWWSNNYLYRRNISISEELGINRSNEYHDFQINFSTWDNRPSCSDEVRIIASNGTEMEREIVNFIYNQSVYFTIRIDNMTEYTDDYIFLYYGCDSPSSPGSVDYDQTEILLDEETTIEDLGNGRGPYYITDEELSMTEYENGVNPPMGDYMAKLSGYDMTAYHGPYTNIQDYFSGSSLDPMWTKSSYNAGITDIDVDESGYLYPTDYGTNTSDWHGPMISSTYYDIRGSFVMEAEFNTESDPAAVMGLTRIEMLNESEERLWSCSWVDAWGFEFKSKITLYDSEKNLYDSGKATTYNDFEGKMKIERIDNDEVKFYIDNGAGYVQKTLSDVPSDDSLNGTCSRVRITFANYTDYQAPSVHKLDWIKIESNESSYWYAEFCNETKSVPAGQYLGYYLYWVNTSDANAGHGGIDGNYSGGGSMGIGSPIAYDQNGIMMCPNESVLANANNTWYYRFTDDLGGKEITSWFLAYNDTIKNELEDFVLYFDYLFYGPNKGPLSSSISEEETRYYQTGYVISTETTEPPFNSRFGILQFDTTIDENQSIYLSIIDADDNQVIPGYSYIPTTNVSLEGIDTIQYRQIQLVAYLTSDGHDTPLLHGWSVDYNYNYHSGMAYRNRLTNNTIGIMCNSSCPPIISNWIYENEEYGIKVNSIESDVMEYSRTLDSLGLANLFEEEGYIEETFILPSRTSVLNSSIHLTGARYVPWGNVSQTFICKGEAKGAELDLELNDSMEINKPDAWKNSYVRLVYYNLTDNEATVNATDINLSAWHNSTNYTFDNSGYLYISEEVTLDSQDPLVVDLTSNASNAKLNVSGTSYVYNTTELIWVRNSIGYNTTLTLYQPDSNIISPELHVYAPAPGFAEIECTVSGTEQSLSDNFTVSGSIIVLDLSEIDGMGDTWNATDSDYILNISLVYYLDSPRLDFGNDGSYDWEWDGEFNQSVTIYPDSMYEKIAQCLDMNVLESVEVPLTLGADSAGYLNISNIRIETKYMADIYGNTIRDSDVGINVHNTTELRAGYNKIYDNDRGIEVMDTPSRLVRYNHFGDLDESFNISLTGDSDESRYLLIPANAIITDLDFNITGSKYVPPSERETGYQTQGNLITTNETVLNSTIGLSVPSGWEGSKLTIYADDLTREYGDNVFLWGEDYRILSSAYHNLSTTRWHNTTGMENISFIESAAIPDSTTVYFATSNMTGNLDLYMWEDNRVSDECYAITSTLRSSSLRNFDIEIMDEETPVVFWANESGGLVGTTVENGVLYNYTSDIPEISQLYVEFLPWDSGILVIAVNESEKIFSSFFSSSGFSTPDILTSDFENSSNASISLVKDTVTNTVFLGWQCENGTMGISQYTYSEGWTNLSFEDDVDAIAIKSAFNESSGNVYFMYAATYNAIRVIQWNGSGDDTYLWYNVSNPGPAIFDIVYNSISNMTMVAIYNDSNLHTKIFDGNQWNWFENRSVTNFEELKFSSHFRNGNISLSYLDSIGNLKCYIGNDTFLGASPLSIGSNVTNFTSVFEYPQIPPEPTTLNLTAMMNNYVKYFNDFLESTEFWSSEFNDATNLTVHLNKTLYEYSAGLFTSVLEVYNHTQINWTKGHDGYCLNLTLWPSPVNLSEPELRLIIPNSCFTDVEVWVNKSQPSTYQMADLYIDTSTRDYGYITVDLTNVTDIGTYWTPDDDPVNLTIYLNFTPMDFTLDIGDNDVTEFEECGVFNYTMPLDSERNITAREVNYNVVHTSSMMNKITFYTASEYALNVTVSNITMEYVFGPMFENNDIYDNENNTYTSAACAILDSNDITGSDNYATYLENTTQLMINNNVSEGVCGIHLDNSTAYIFGNDIYQTTIGINASGRTVEIFDNEIDNNTIGINVLNASLLRIDSNSLSGNDDGIVCNKNMTSEIRSNILEDNAHRGVFCDNGTNAALYDNIFDDNPTGLYMLYSNVTMSGNTFEYNDIGVKCDNFFYFDLNNDSNSDVYYGWYDTKVAEYTEQRGFGYIDSDDVYGSSSGGEGNNLEKDYHWSSYSKDFKVDIPNGEYDITLYYSYGSLYIDSVYMIPTVTSGADGVSKYTTNWTVVNGTINFEFHRAGKMGFMFWRFHGLSIVPTNRTFQSSLDSNVMQMNCIGMYLNGSSYAIISNSSFNGNEYGILMDNDTINTIEECDFSFNDYAIYVNSSILEIDDSEISGSYETDFTITENSSVVSAGTYYFNQTFVEGCRWGAIFPHWVGNKPVDVRIGDVSCDGFNDIITANYDDGNVTILEWNNSGKYWTNVSYVYPRSITGNPSNPVSLDIGNVSGDPQNEIVTVDASQDLCSVLRWNTDSWSVGEINVGTNYHPMAVDIADVNSTSNGNEIVIACRDNCTIRVYSSGAPYNNIDTIYTKNPIDSKMLHPTDVVCKDVDADGDTEIIVSAYWYVLMFPIENYILIYEYSNGNWIHFSNSPIQVSNNTTAIDAGDIIADENNYMEIVASHNNANNVTVLDYDGSNFGFASIDGYSVGNNPSSVHCTDNSYGDSLILTTDYDDDQITIQNPYKASDVQTISVGDGPKSVFTGDVDGDGDNDIVVANENDDNVNIIEWSGGSFHHMVTISAFTVEWDKDNKRENDKGISGSEIIVYNPGGNILEKGITDEHGHVAIKVLQDFMTSSTIFHYENYTIGCEHDLYANRSDYTFDVLERTEYYVALDNQDIDDDGISDADEVMIWKTDKTESDTDDDGLLDGTEVGKDAYTIGWLSTNFYCFDSDPMTHTDPRQADTDHDGIIDGWKDGKGEDPNLNGRVDTGETDPFNPDCDNDGLLDGAEDKDGDGVVDPDETDPWNPDTDGGGINDGTEVAVGGMDPLDENDDYLLLEERRNASGGGDGGQDGSPINDTDGDGLSNEWENETSENNSLLWNDIDSDDNYRNDADEDYDGDGLCNLYEFWSGTDPHIIDSDNDDVNDSDEDFDNDGLSNILEQGLGTYPGLWDSDYDGLGDGIEDYNQDGCFKFSDDDTNPLSNDTDGDGLLDDFESPRDNDGNKLVFFIDKDRYPNDFMYHLFDGDMDLANIHGRAAFGEYQIWISAKTLFHYPDDVTIKWVSKKYGTCQSDIVSIDPFLKQYTWYHAEGYLILPELGNLVIESVNTTINQIILVRTDYLCDQILDEWDDYRSVDYSSMEISDALKQDTDEDGESDYDELFLSETNPLDYYDNGLDNDNDGLPNSYEELGWYAYAFKDRESYENANEAKKYGNDPLQHIYYHHVYSDPNSADTDGDGLNDLQEFMAKINPTDTDTDGDHLDDNIDDCPSVFDLNPPLIEYVNLHYASPDNVDFDYHVRDKSGIKYVCLFKEGQLIDTNEYFGYNEYIEGYCTENNIGWEDWIDGHTYYIEVIDVYGNVNKSCNITMNTLFDWPEKAVLWVELNLPFIRNAIGANTLGGIQACEDVGVRIIEFFTHFSEMLECYINLSRSFMDHFGQTLWNSMKEMIQGFVDLFPAINGKQDNDNPYDEGTWDYTDFQIRWWEGYIGTLVGLIVLSAILGSWVVEAAQGILSALGAVSTALTTVLETMHIPTAIAAFVASQAQTIILLSGLLGTSLIAPYLPDVVKEWLATGFGLAFIYLEVSDVADADPDIDYCNKLGYISKVAKKNPRKYSQKLHEIETPTYSRFDIAEDLYKLKSIKGAGKPDNVFHRIYTNEPKNKGAISELRVACHSNEFGTDKIAYLGKWIENKEGKIGEIDILLKNGECVEVKAKKDWRNVYGDLFDEKNQYEKMKGYIESSENPNAKIMVYVLDGDIKKAVEDKIKNSQPGVEIGTDIEICIIP